MKNSTRLIKTEEQIQAVEKEIKDQVKRIDFFISELSIEYLAEKTKNGIYYIPDYQRNFTWDETRKCRFIESIFMGLPIPFLVFWQNEETGKLEIVDGSQRLRTLVEFLHGDKDGNFLELTDLEALPSLNGFLFSELSEARQNKFIFKTIRGIVLAENTDEAARFELFERINTGSLIANSAEIRRGAHPGKFMDLIVRLSKDETFIKLTPLSDKAESLREREELVTRFFAYTNGLEGYKDRVSDFIYAYTNKMNANFEKNPEKSKEFENNFMKTMEFIAKAFPYGFKRVEHGTASPRTRFESIAVGSFLAIKERPNLLVTIPDVLSWFDGAEYKKIIRSDGANVRSILEKRIYFVRDKLLGLI